MSASAVQRFYRVHAPLYDSTRWLILRGRRQAVAYLNLRPNSRVLEVGCGTGLSFRYLLEYLDPREGQLTGLDFSSHMLRRAARRIARHGWRQVELIEADAVSMDLGRDFDAIFFAYSLTMIPQWKVALARARAHLAPGGTLVVLDFGSFRRWGPLGAVVRAWLRFNHVETDRPYEEELRKLFATVQVHQWLGGYCFAAVAHLGS